ncbi:hypothetical protein CC1G_15693 [Coprinopsis cinerea okayama7|uniref:DUF6593 domain-containing protein n=1 Tax=Coprinopsis cinerea (strain Okayama-7 / 130 / ATCC MYA-4618 / FGSC 9003) TaxID=240176 RepID=D6RQF4_COPC7|nr:hypothetical protein CC1G_15693 [Coprinopsis cinerea okayama7\|eukprot:XP_002910264.1 hypothetical protein CC1G_15693 [Coprinopsis cinerea okayama7\
MADSSNSNLRYLILTPDNPCNTTITDQETGEKVYTVKTEHPDHSYTKVTRVSDGELIASWQWREIRSDLLTLGKAPPVSSSGWLRKSKIPFVHSVYFDDDQKREYTWKGNAPGETLELYTKGKKNPIAQFKKQFRYTDRKQTPPQEVNIPAKLTLDPRAFEIQDLVVISFLLLEKERRIRDASASLMADSLAVPDFNGDYGSGRQPRK